MYGAGYLLDIHPHLDQVSLFNIPFSVLEHQAIGGLGSAVAEALVQNSPVPVEIVAVQDMFGQTGTPDQLLQAYHLKAVDVAAAVRKVLKRKRG